MKADLTRATFYEDRHFRSVRMQQGRVQLDAEWNEQQDITLHRIETETLDVVGYVGAPADDAGLTLTPTADKKSLAISPGRLYVNGILCENDTSGIQLDTQPDLPPSACVIANGVVGGLPANDGVYIGFVHVWPYHLTALEVPSIREIALGGPDTTTRLKTVWQVQALRVGDLGTSFNCLSDSPAWDTLTQATTGTMAARAEPTPDPISPCKLAPTAGYRRLDNLLYRVEIHLIPGKDPAFKWSHDNGSIEATWLSSAPGTQPNTVDLTVSSPGRDSTLSIAAGQYVELFDRNSELLFTPGTLVKVLNVEGTTVTVDTTTATGSTKFTDFGKWPRVRRWDGFVPSIPQATVASTEGGWIALEDGVEVQFQPAGGTFRHGDYWMFAARTATAISPATIEWPVDSANNPVFEHPQGPAHAYARLAVLSCTGGLWSVLFNCAPSFPPLTELKNLYYVGGDAQCVLTTEPLALPKPLEVSVANGSLPVAGATVRFTITGGTGTLGAGGTTFDATTSAAGIASCTWTLDPNTPHQYVQAVIVEGGVPVTDKYQPVHFSANLLDQDACTCTVCVSVQAQGKDATAIQQAIDKVIKNGGGTICLEAGAYNLTSALSISETTTVRLRGQGIATSLRIIDGPAIAVTASQQIVITDLAIETTTSGSGLEAVNILETAPADTPNMVAIQLTNVTDVRLERLTIQLDTQDAISTGIGLGAPVNRLVMVGNSITAPNGLSGPYPTGDALPVNGIDIADNQLSCSQNGIKLQLAESTGVLRIRRNYVRQCAGAGIAIDGRQLPGMGTVLEVSENVIAVTGNGMVCNIGALDLYDNDVSCTTGPNVAAQSSGISVTPLVGSQGAAVRVAANRVTGFPGTAIAVQSAVPSLSTDITDNLVSLCGRGIAYTGSGAAQSARIAVNQLNDITPFVDPNSPQGIEVYGITMVGANQAAIVNNTLMRCGQNVSNRDFVFSIGAWQNEIVQICGNVVCGLGPESGALAAVGIMTFPPMLQVSIADNQLRRDLASGIPADNADWLGIMVVNSAEFPPPTANSLFGKQGVPRAIAAILSRKRTTAPPAGTTLATGAALADTTVPMRAMVRGNQVITRSVSASIYIQADQCLLDHNMCERTTISKPPVPSVLTQVGNAIVSGNHVTDTPTTEGSWVMQLGVGGGFTVLGNVTSTTIQVNGKALPQPWAPLNALG